MEDKIDFTIHEYEKEVSSYHNNYLSPYEEERIPVSPELLNAVNFIESRAKLYSDIITPKMLSLQELGISYFVELDQRLKKRNRVIKKILQKMEVDKKNMLEAIKSIGDSLRFTIVINDDDLYIEKVDEYLKKIRDLGYDIIRFKNVWGGEYYQGINVIFETADGFNFELQFHTLNSYAIKEGKLREVYNIIRDPKSPPELVTKCNLIRKHYQKTVKIPKDALEYKYEVSKKK